MHLISNVNDFIEKDRMYINSSYYQNDNFLKSIILLVDDTVLLHIVLFSIILKIKYNIQNFIYIHFYNKNKNNIKFIENYMIDTNIEKQISIISKKQIFQMYISKLSKVIFTKFQKSLLDFVLYYNDIPIKNL